MEVRNCRSCTRLFNYIGGPNICPQCRDELEKKYMVVKDFIRENPGASIQTVADENDVSTQQIKQWIREERLEFSKDSTVTIECEKCGASIRTGRYCKACKDKMADSLSQLIAKPQEQTVRRERDGKNAMRFL